MRGGIIENESKMCSKCKEIKKYSEFNKNRCMRDGHQYICKCCSRKYDKSHYYRNRERKNRKRLELHYLNKAIYDSVILAFYNVMWEERFE